MTKEYFLIITNLIKIVIFLLEYHILADLEDTNELYSSVINVLSLTKCYKNPHQLQHQLTVKVTTLKIHHLTTILMFFNIYENPTKGTNHIVYKSVT